MDWRGVRCQEAEWLADTKWGMRKLYCACGTDSLKSYLKIMELGITEYILLSFTYCMDCGLTPWVFNLKEDARKWKRAVGYKRPYRFVEPPTRRVLLTDV